ncbi:hypothetical protein ACVGVM_08690 [Pseudonocardia bannensis]|uniref:Uncharacterized protein n=1 Tax=Pseudonocardia bannensis TaxID=630973 RepID=A0A848DLB1_9PSEU|nr:hypothetical protein [Pseudonocardia bannensis]NMH93488.1 hypothetical protein [Pseudonocardia bannensis]
MVNGAAVVERGYELHAPGVEVAERAGSPVAVVLEGSCGAASCAGSGGGTSIC